MNIRLLSIYCPHCEQHTSLDPAPVEISVGSERSRVPAIWEVGEYERWWIGVCNSCEQAVLVHELGESSAVYPHALPSPTDSNIPDPMRGDLDEAKRCFSVSAWRGAAVLARRAIQSSALDKGAKIEKLAEQIAELQTKGAIINDLKQWADVVRWVGNDAAHPGGDAVTEEDAEEILKLAEQFLHVLYVTPARASALRKKKGK